MKTKLLFLLATSFILQNSLCSQTYTEATLQETYWNYRDLFRKNYTHIGIEHGKSIPFEGLHEIDVIRTVNPGHADIHGRIDYGDANITHGYYLAVLASEFRLLINSNPIDWEAVTACRNELYFALEAINRIDQYSNMYFIQGLTFPSQPLDGFLTRGDVTPNFYQYGLEDKAGYTKKIILN